LLFSAGVQLIADFAYNFSMDFGCDIDYSAFLETVAEVTERVKAHTVQYSEELAPPFDQVQLDIDKATAAQAELAQLLKALKDYECAICTLKTAAEGPPVALYVTNPFECLRLPPDDSWIRVTAENLGVYLTDDGTWQSLEPESANAVQQWLCNKRARLEECPTGLSHPISRISYFTLTAIAKSVEGVVNTKPIPRERQALRN